MWGAGRLKLQYRCTVWPRIAYSGALTLTSGEEELSDLDNLGLGERTEEPSGAEIREDERTAVLI